MKDLLQWPELRRRICVVLSGDKNEDVRKIVDVEWIELRIDEFLRRNKEDALLEWMQGVRNSTKAKIIATVRWYKEAGENPFYIKDRKRIEIIRDVIDYADFVDIELKSRILEEVVSIVKGKGKKVVVSYHNFKKTPGKEILRDIIKKGKRKNAEIIKIATLTETEKNLFTLIKVLNDYKEKIPMVIIPMCENPFIRFIPLFFGSLFTYLPYNIKVAPGQISYFEFLKYLDIIRR